MRMHGECSALIDRARSELSRGAYESATTSFETLVSKLLMIIEQRQHSETAIDRVDIERTTESVCTELCVVVSDVLARVSTLPQCEQTLLLHSVESLCELLWKLRTSSNQGKIFALRYTLIRRFAGCQEQHKVLRACWSFLSGLLEHSADAKCFDVAELQAVYIRRKNEKHFVSILIGVLLNLLGSFALDADEVDFHEVDKILGVSGVVCHIVDLLTTMPIESAEKHVNGFASNSLRMVAYLSRLTHTRTDAVRAQINYCRVLVKCIHFFKAERKFVLMVCTRIIKYVHFDHMYTIMDAVKNTLENFNSSDFAFVCEEIVKCGIKNNSCVEARCLLESLFSAASLPWFVIVACGTLRLKHRTVVFDSLELVHILSEMKCVNKTFTCILSTAKSSEYLRIVRMYNTYARQVNSFSDTCARCDITLLKRVSRELLCFYSFSPKIVGYLCAMSGEEMRQCAELPQFYLHSIAAIMRFELQACENEGLSTTSFEFIDLFKQLLHGKSQLNNVNSRRTIYTLASFCINTGFPNTAISLLRLALTHCLRSDETETMKFDEISKQIRPFTKILLETGRSDQASDILTDVVKGSELSGMSFNSFLTIYADIIKRTWSAYESVDEKLTPFVLQYQDVLKDSSTSLASLVQEFSFWNKHNISPRIKHKLLEQILDMAMNLRGSTSTYTIVQLDTILRLLQIALPIVPFQCATCASMFCSFCRHANVRKLCSLICKKIYESADEVSALVAATEVTCRTALSLVCSDKEHGFERAQAIIRDELPIRKLQHIYTQLEMYKKKSTTSHNRFSQMSHALEETCAMFTAFGTTYLSTELKMYLRENTSPVISVLLAPFRAPDLFFVTHTSFLRPEKNMETDEYFKARSMLSLASIEVERGQYSRAFSYVELAIPLLKGIFCSHRLDKSTGSIDSTSNRVLHIINSTQRSSWHCLGMYIFSFCMRASICTELGMRTSSILAAEEALQLALSTYSPVLETVVRLRKADVYQRFEQVQESMDQILKCQQVMLPPWRLKTSTSWSTVLDSQTCIYAAAHASYIESMCDFKSGNSLKSTAEMEKATEYVNEGLNLSKSNYDVTLQALFRLLLIRISCTRLLSTTTTATSEMANAIELMFSKCRCYQPTVWGLILLCKIHALHQENNLMIDEQSRATYAHFSTEPLGSLLQSVMSIFRDVPFTLHQAQPLIMRTVLDEMDSAPRSIVRALHFHNGSVLRSQHLALLTKRSFARRFKSSADFNNAEICDNPFNCALTALAITDNEIAQICGRVDSEDVGRWTVCGYPVVTISLHQPAAKDSSAELILSRVCESAKSALYMKIPSKLIHKVLDEFSVAVQNQHTVKVSTPTRESKIQWWEDRLRLDLLIKHNLAELEYVLGPWKVFLLGEIDDSEQRFEQALQLLSSELDILAKSNGFCLIPRARDYVLLLLQGLDHITTKEFTQALTTLFVNPARVQCEYLEGLPAFWGKCKYDLLESVSLSAIKTQKMLETSKPKVAPRKAILLSLDSSVKHVPWESISVLKHQRVYRIPAVAIGQAIVSLRAYGQRENIVDLRRSYFVLNPSGDLIKTQEYLEPLLAKSGWTGSQGRTPSISEAIQALTDFECYFYFGHGAGQDVTHKEAMKDIVSCAASVLMGCSSGVYDYTDSSAAACTSILYLFAGAPFVLGNLWDVTDGDIDRFSAALLKEWLSQSVSYASSTMETFCAADAVQHARKACQLQFLVGAAPVIYGVPTRMWDSGHSAI
mmetsp:Transcript_2282/g.8461  ORF Transcript_2282/g.8461 Transcript_2282/m.8461 type:complete len:1740 (-) Transcript_2282:1501-6720(-)|eukprot:CAMPEP_0174588212 /NCGR_PEP_ID=MMETSP0929-20130131/34451_1 /TAXON_ID=548131 ORGANISM="Ostreococcus mediterraneus, Strain clade-D-RCC2572" /NCGR_SAMPLE_ID=MMETSP0929 /ASSEMBLY_ACC=CAM_ASM_000573 /LENGTH=1739 /DNA_ID=CAMNT_0015770315 /DNA_START=173 /DNA_END=5392 /DNA_ORIENTATION=+